MRIRNFARRAASIFLRVKYLPRHQLVTIAVALLAVASVYLTARPYDGSLGPLYTRNVLRWVLFATFFILLVFGKQAKYKLIQITCSAMVPVSVIFFLIYLWLDPVGADGLAREGRLIEDFSFFFLMVGSVCMAVVAYTFAKRRDRISMVLSVLLTLVFFLIGMEEISWFQRVLDIEPSEFFVERNQQSEMNIHNFYTVEFEESYYLAGFVLLVVLPFFQASLRKYLHRVGWLSAHYLLPPPWLITPFALAGGFRTPPAGDSSAVGSIILIGSLVILIGLISRYYGQRNWWRIGHVTGTCLLLGVTAVIVFNFNYEDNGIRYWEPKEWQEFFIAWGIAAYAFSVVAEIWSHGIWSTAGKEPVYSPDRPVQRLP